jgi:outer membrane protein assembly factor BamB
MNNSSEPSVNANDAYSAKSARTNETPQKTSGSGSAPNNNRLRIWPVGLIAVLGLWCWFGPTYLEQADMYRFGALALGALGQTLLILVWTLGFSKAKLRTRIFMLLFGIGTIMVAAILQHQSIGISILLFGIPMAIMSLGGFLFLTSKMRWESRRWILALAWALPILAWVFVRNDGFKASFFPEVRGRWTKSSEQKLASKRTQHGNRELAIEPKASDWSRFRGTKLDGKPAKSELTANPKGIRTVWKQPAGPSWSSVIVVGEGLFTFEQRGENEAVVCLEAATGNQVWAYEYPCRFEDSTRVSGAGPRGTPTYYQGKLYTVGAKGHIKSITASSGQLVWERELMEDVGGNIPVWGFSTSPLLVDDCCYVMSNADSEKSECKADVVCYDANNGSIRWKGTGFGATYSSPTIVDLQGVRQLLVAHLGSHNEEAGQQVISRDPATGKELWRYSSQQSGMTMTTPIQLDDSSLLIVDGPAGATRLTVTKEKDSDTWTVTKSWSQGKMLPEYSDLVVQGNLVVGLSKDFLTALNLESGKLLWKKRGFGGGQVIATQDAILVQAEQGTLSLVSVNEKGATSIAESEGIVGKTWNHPIQVGNRLYARNAEEIACFEFE